MLDFNHDSLNEVTSYFYSIKVYVCILIFRKHWYLFFRNFITRTVFVITFTHTPVNIILYHIVTSKLYFKIHLFHLNPIPTGCRRETRKNINKKQKSFK